MTEMTIEETTPRVRTALPSPDALSPCSMRAADEPLPPPSRTAALARVAAVRPMAYARTRNSLDGAVSGLSPYLTHGFVTLREVVAGVAWRHPLRVKDKFVFELGWRAWFRHVWAHRGERILEPLHRGALPESAYVHEMPEDVRAACTGVPAIDEAVRTLYRTGLLHNHARMWLASYLVHLRKVHWRTGADWMLGHLLDGDLASNHLSWQWIAGTASRQPYVFNAANVARHAPLEWHSFGTAVDASYPELDAIARDPKAVLVEPPSRPRPEPVDEPARHALPPASPGLAPDPAVVRGRDVWLVHPWSLGPLPAGLPADTVVLGALVDELHARHPWTARRWEFVAPRMADLASATWHAPASAIGAALASARSVRTMADPHVATTLGRFAVGEEPAPLFREVERPCDSFSAWWTAATRGLETAADLLAVHEGRGLELPPE